MAKKFKVGDTIWWKLESQRYPEWNGWKSSKVEAVFDEDEVYGVYTYHLLEKNEYPGGADLITFGEAYDQPQE